MFVWTISEAIDLGIAALIVVIILCGLIFLFIIAPIYWKIKKFFKKKENVDDKVEQ